MPTYIAQITNPVINPSVGAGEGGQALAITIANLWRALVIVGGLALFIYLALGAIDWLTAGGDKAKVEQARQRITNAIIGMAILVASVAISLLLSQTLGIEILRPVFPTP